MRVSMGTGTLPSRSCREYGRFADSCQNFFSITRKKVKKFCEMRSRKEKTALNLHVGVCRFLPNDPPSSGAGASEVPALQKFPAPCIRLKFGLAYKTRLMLYLNLRHD